MSVAASERYETAISWDNRPPTVALRLLAAVVVLAVFAAPFVMMIAGSLDAGVSARSVSLWPKSPTLGNYEAAASAGLFHYLARSLIIAGGGLLLQIIVSVLAAYALAHLDFRLKSVMMGIFLITIMVPEELIAVPLSLVLRDVPLLGIDLRGSVFAVILPVAAWGFSILLMSEFMREIPTEILEAARLDGVGEVQMLWMMVLPLCRSALGVIIIFGFNMVWDQYLLPLIAANSPADYTLTVALRSLGTAPDVGPGIVMAGAVLGLLPSLIVYLCLQKSLIRGITSGSLK